MTLRFDLLGNRPANSLQAGGEDFDFPGERFKGSPEIRLRRWAIVGILLTVLLTGIMSLLTWQSARQGEEGEDWVVHTFLVEQRLQAAVGHSSGAENRARVFAVTGNQTVLDPYKNRQLALEQDLTALRQLTADNRSQQERLDRLEPQVAASMESERKIQDERERTGTPPSAGELVEDKLRMDEVRATLVEMQGEEARLLTLRIGRTQQARHLTRITVLSTALVGVALLVVSGFVLLREIDRSARMRGQVKTLNVELELQAIENRRVEAERKGLRYARSLIEACLDPLVTISREGKITDVNEAATKITGISREGLIGSDFSDFFTDPESARRAYEQAFEHGAVKNYPLSIRDAEGNHTDVVYNASVFRDETGQVQGVFAAARDITERKKAEAAVRESDERFRLLVDPVKEYAIYMLDPQGCVVTWNAGAERCKGYTAAEAIGRHVSIFFLPEDAEAGLPSKELARAERDGRFETEAWRIRKDGTKFWALVTLTATYRQDGTLRGFAKVTRDLTVQKRAEDALLSLNSQLEHYRIVVEHIEEYAIYTLDAEGMITSWGNGAQKVSGASAEEVIGQHYSFFFPAAAVLAGVPQSELAEAARTGRYAVDAWMVTPDGDRKWSSGVLTAVRNESGELTGFIRVARDMTSYKQADEDLREANRALRESEERFRLLVEPVKDYAIYMLDPEGCIVTWNAGAERCQGYTAAEAIGRHLSLFFLPEEVEAGLPSNELESAEREGRFETEGWRIRKDGTKFWALVTLTATYGQDGSLRGFAKVMRDMTAQKQAIEDLHQANRALVESEERFRLLVEPVKDYGIFMLDPEGRVVTWNVGAERIKGYKTEDVLGKNFSIFFLTEEADAGFPAQELATAAREGRFEAETWRVRKDGTKFWALVTLTAVYGQDGTLRGFAKVFRDMTAQKQAIEDLRVANRALVESEERFRLLVEPVKDYAIYMLDSEGRVLTWNEGAERSKGYKASEVVGQNFAMFYLPEDSEAGMPAAELATAAREGRFETAAWRIRKDGTMFWGLITLTALQGQDGALRGFATVTRDMTAQKQLEDSLQHLAADLETRVDERTRQLETTMVELRHKNEEVEAFVYIVSHDMRAPLVNLMGFARELGESCAKLKSLVESLDLPGAQRSAVSEILDADLPSAVHFISQSSLKFERLIDALLDLSRYGRQVYRIVEADAGELVASAVANSQQAITEANATVEVGRLPSVKADMTALGQVFANLIGNSLKYRSPERPLKLEVGGAIVDGTVNYWVRDNGLGIPEASKSRLFQVFQRFHPQRAQGEGMGLAIAHRIVERHGGRIWAESREGEGTTFHFSLPGDGASNIPGFEEDVVQEEISHGKD